LALLDPGFSVSTFCRIAASDFVSSPSTRTRVAEKDRALMAIASMCDASAPFLVKQIDDNAFLHKTPVLVS
jgi:hypothetical protein